MRTFVIAIAAVLLSAPALAQMPRPIGVPPVGAAPLTNQQVLDIAFTEIERQMIGDFYARQRAEAERDALPPGLQKHLDKRGTLPPGLAKKALPTDLDRLLPRPAYGSERMIVDNDVLLVQIGTGIILDILVDALVN
ncbi:MAG: hypothetical protein EXQ88_01210 [Alphaproteobacteria bacterium]|nr:hypothetical protein [Alphaproteobacteria bacterium]